MADLVGQSVDRYHVLEQLGEGGMAIVYKAYDTRLERDVALKVIRTEKLTLETMSKSLKRFEREAKALGKLTHPNIVPVSDYGEYEGKPYLVMPYLPGGTLKQRMGNPMPWQEAVQLLLPIAEALDYAHDQNMIHRDVKPSNILLTQRGQPMLTDFGIAKILDLEETQDLTGTSAAVGTPEYMAPEQATAKSVDKRADIYSLGIVLYEMVTGRKPFIADTPMAVLIKQATEPLPRPSQFVTSLPDELEKVLLKALAKDRENRYQRMDEFSAALRGLMFSKVPAQPIAVPPRRPAPQPVSAIEKPEPTERISVSPKPKSKIPWAWIGLLMVCIVGLAGILSLGGILYPKLVATPTVLPTPTVIPTEWIDPQGATMRMVTQGTFTMGNDAGDPDERPAHQVALDAYYMDVYEVTNAMYKSCVSAGVCKPPRATRSATREAYYDTPEFEKHPVIFVSWDDAKTYCEWRGARLPTEAEWEKAARGLDSRKYPWGEGLDCNKANYYSCAGDTVAVGSYGESASPFGIFDLVGNVWEWVSDWYSETYYLNSIPNNPIGPTSGVARVSRGGSFSNPGSRIYVTNRNWYPQTNVSENVGFRCVRSIP